MAEVAGIGVIITGNSGPLVAELTRVTSHPYKVTVDLAIGGQPAALRMLTDLNSTALSLDSNLRGVLQTLQGISTAGSIGGSRARASGMNEEAAAARALKNEVNTLRNFWQAERVTEGEAAAGMQKYNQQATVMIDVLQGQIAALRAKGVLNTVEEKELQNLIGLQNSYGIALKSTASVTTQINGGIQRGSLAAGVSAGVRDAANAVSLLTNQYKAGIISQSEYTAGLNTQRASLLTNLTAVQSESVALRELGVLSTQDAARLAALTAEERQLTAAASQTTTALERQAAAQRGAAAGALGVRGGAGMNGAAIGLSFVDPTLGMAAFALSMGPAIAGLAALGLGMKVFGDGVDKAAVFQRSLTQIGALTHQSGAEMNVYGSYVQQLSTQLPLTTQQLLELGRQAVLVGLHGSEGIKTYTENMAGLSIVLRDVNGHSADTAAVGQEVVKVLRSMGADTAGVNQQFAGAVNSLVSLKTQFGAQVPEITNLAKYWSSYAHEIGLTTDQVFGWSAALVSVGARAQGAGGSLQKFFQKLASDASEGSEGMGQWAKVMHMTADEALNLVRTDPSAFLKRFIESLPNFMRDGKDSAAVLAQFGLVSNQVTRAFSELGVSSKNVDKALKDAKDGINDTGLSLRTAMAATRDYKDQQVLLTNAFDAFKTNVGQGVTPAMTALLGWFLDMSKAALNLSQYLNGTLGAGQIDLAKLAPADQADVQLTLKAIDSLKDRSDAAGKALLAQAQAHLEVLKKMADGTWVGPKPWEVQNNRAAASLFMTAPGNINGAGAPVLNDPRTQAKGWNSAFIGGLKDIFVSDPQVDSDCASIASAILKTIGVKIAGSANAGVLAKQVAATGARKVGVGDARPGDFVDYAGPGYGKVSGHHSAVVVGKDEKGRLLIIENPGSSNTQVVPIYDTSHATIYRPKESPYAEAKTAPVPEPGDGSSTGISLKELQATLTKLTADYKQGKISLDVYHAGLEAVRSKADQLAGTQKTGSKEWTATEQLVIRASNALKTHDKATEQAALTWKQWTANRAQAMKLAQTESDLNDGKLSPQASIQAKADLQAYQKDPVRALALEEAERQLKETQKRKEQAQRDQDKADKEAQRQQDEHDRRVKTAGENQLKADQALADGKSALAKTSAQAVLTAYDLEVSKAGSSASQKLLTEQAWSSKRLAAMNTLSRAEAQASVTNLEQERNKLMNAEGVTKVQRQDLWNQYAARIAAVDRGLTATLRGNQQTVTADLQRAKDDELKVVQDNVAKVNASLSEVLSNPDQYGDGARGLTTPLQVGLDDLLALMPKTQAEAEKFVAVVEDMARAGQVSGQTLADLKGHVAALSVESRIAAGEFKDIADGGRDAAAASSNMRISLDTLNEIFPKTLSDADGFEKALNDWATSGAITNEMLATMKLRLDALRESLSFDAGLTEEQARNGAYADVSDGGRDPKGRDFQPLDPTDQHKSSIDTDLLAQTTNALPYKEFQQFLETVQLSQEDTDKLTASWKAFNDQVQSTADAVNKNPDEYADGARGLTPKSGDVTDVEKQIEEDRAKGQRDLAALEQQTQQTAEANKTLADAYAALRAAQGETVGSNQGMIDSLNQLWFVAGVDTKALQELIDKLKQLDQQAKDRANLDALASGLQQIGSTFEQLDGAAGLFGKTLSSLGSGIQLFQKIPDLMSKTSAAMKGGSLFDMAGALGGWLGLAAEAINIIGGIGDAIMNLNPGFQAWKKNLTEVANLEKSAAGASVGLFKNPFADALNEDAAKREKLAGANFWQRAAWALFGGAPEILSDEAAKLKTTAATIFADLGESISSNLASSLMNAFNSTDWIGSEKAFDKALDQEIAKLVIAADIKASKIPALLEQYSNDKAAGKDTTGDLAAIKAEKGQLFQTVRADVSGLPSYGSDLTSSSSSIIGAAPAAVWGAPEIKLPDIALSALQNVAMMDIPLYNTASQRILDAANLIVATLGPGAVGRAGTGGLQS